jgi:hypothetical protein
MSTDDPSYEEVIEDLFPPIVPEEVGDVQYPMFWCSREVEDEPPF